MIVVSPTQGQSLFMDYRDGTQKWESFILDELLAHVGTRFGVDRQATLVAGYSQGGLGALRMAFKQPSRFRAVAAWAPGVEPAFAFREIAASDRAHRPAALYQEVFGSPVGEAYWQANHPPSLLKTRMVEIAKSQLQIYLAVGREDRFNLYRGSELMHRMLEEGGISHEYHLVRDANHGSIFTRRLEGGSEIPWLRPAVAEAALACAAARRRTRRAGLHEPSLSGRRRGYTRYPMTTTARLLRLR